MRSSVLILAAAPALLASVTAYAQPAPAPGTGPVVPPTNPAQGNGSNEGGGPNNQQPPTSGANPGNGGGAVGGVQGAPTGTGASAGATTALVEDKPKDGTVADTTGGTAGARAAGLLPPSAHSNSFMDTRLTWTFGDDDFLHATGELIPLSPTFSIGDRPQYRLFFDNLNSRFAGRENITHLVMYKKLPGFIPHLTTEAAMVLRFDLGALSANTGNLNSALYDSGSYLRIFYNTNQDKEKEGLSAVFFPLDTDRMRLGYLYDNSWGGTAASINQSIFPRIQGISPGLKLQYDHEKFYGFIGFKTATIVQPEKVLAAGAESDVEVVRVGETNYGVLAGGGIDPLPFLRWDVGAGYFQQGKFDLEDVRGKNVYTYGASTRLVVHGNMPVPTSVDFMLYRNDPTSPMIMFRPEKYNPDQVAWSVSAEGSVLQQQLKDFDASGATKQESAIAAALQGVVKAGYLRASLTGIYRNLQFVVRNVPGFIPFETLPKNSSSDPELFGSAAVDYHFPGAHLTPGIAAGFQLPATFRSDFTEGGVPASRTIVVRSQGNESILPYNFDRSVILQMRGSVRWDLSDILGIVGWVQFVRDNNGTLVVRDPKEGTASLRVFQSPNRLGLGVAVQARF
ncbi:MAG: hypothetical protein U0174_24445 [Polyangiaceae bacterium]